MLPDGFPANSVKGFPAQMLFDGFPATSVKGFPALDGFPATSFEGFPAQRGFPPQTLLLAFQPLVEKRRSRPKSC